MSPRVPLSLAASLIVASAVVFAGPSPQDASGNPEIGSIAFEGNSGFSTPELRAQIQTKETPGFLSKFMYGSISEKLGRKDEYLNYVVLGSDVERLHKYYENRGYREARIDTSLQFYDDGAMVNITFKIQEGYRSVIDSLTYRGIPNGPETIWEDIHNGPPRISQGDYYNSLLLEEEVKRVLQVFANNGFPNASFVRDSSYARQYASTGNFKVLLDFKAGRRYRFGPITVEQEVDSLRGISRRDDISDDIVLEHLDYKPNDFYSEEVRQKSERNLNRLGVFDLRRIDVSIPALADTGIMVPSLIVIRPKDKHELAPELIVSNDNDAFNIGAGLGYTDRNFFGGARIFSAHLRFRTQTIAAFPNYFKISNDAVSNFDLTFELLQPYIFSSAVKGTWSFSYIIDKQLPYKLNIFRTRFGINDRFAEYTTGQFDWTLEAIDPRLRPVDSSKIDPVTFRQLQLLSPKQFNSVFSFTIQRDMTNDIFSPSEGFVHSMTLQESGLLPLLIRKVMPNLPYTQFYSASALGRWYYDVGATKRFSILAIKLRAGLEEKYGASRNDSARVIPQTYRFFAGGSGSVRGWNSRSLISTGDPQLGGNLLIDGSVEMRTNPLQALADGFWDKMWIVEFVDFGNLWPTIGDFRFRDVAIAAGLGFRYDTFFGPFRIDWGFRVYDPSEPTGHNWITQRRLLGQTFKEGVFHFGIGHAF
ncbi:MAG: BamA/TamA family outer membrane protein [Bacteroidota bacterium]